MEYEVNGELTSTDFTAYEAPSIERVGSVCGLTAGRSQRCLNRRAAFIRRWPRLRRAWKTTPTEAHVSPLVGARRIGTISFDPVALNEEVDAILALGLFPCADGVGDWRHRILWNAGTSDCAPSHEAIRQRLPYLDSIIRRTFVPAYLKQVRVFAAWRGGLIRPHVDYPVTDQPFARLHIPLRTNDRAFNSEGDDVYHMNVGEIWFLDGTRAHSAVCFSDEPRVHLILDVDPKPSLHELFLDPTRYSESTQRPVIERPALTDDEVAAIHGLAAIATEKNLPAILDFLSTIHFGRAVGSAACYDWLVEIADRTEDGRLSPIAQRFKRAYCGDEAREMATSVP